MKKKSLIIGLVILSGILFMNFATNSATEETKSMIRIKEKVVGSNPQDIQVNKDVEMCFEFENDKFSNLIEMHFLDNNKVKGIMSVYVHDEEMGYSASSYSDFEGEISGTQIKVELTIEIEDNIEHESGIWEYKDEILTIDEMKYTKVECKKDEE